MKKTIQYGMGPEYLPNWGLKEALREVYQNFIDYGEFETVILSESEDLIYISLRNSYIPEKLEFLRIGNSHKTAESIGKHGEGLKMAMLIFAREDVLAQITTSKFILHPRFQENEECGSLFCMDYFEPDTNYNQFMVNFAIDPTIYKEFVNDIITSEDVLFSSKMGSILNKPKGRIYSGGLFVSEVKNLSKSYDIHPRYLNLDRDRATPSTFDVHYYASKLNDHYGQFTLEDLKFNDFSYISEIPTAIKEQIKPIIVGNEIEFIANDEVIKNSSVTEHLRSDGFFKTQIDKLKLSLMKGLGLYDLLLAFQEKHVSGSEAREDFQYILDQVKLKGNE